MCGNKYAYISCEMVCLHRLKSGIGYVWSLICVNIMCNTWCNTDEQTQDEREGQRNVGVERQESFLIGGRSNGRDR